MNSVYFIIGCTASGKGAAGRELARRVGGQIVSVDSMKVYRRMDIGTAKPPAAVRAEIPHHCIDIVEPTEHFSVAQYLRHANAAIESIRTAGAIPLAVGGTSLYLKAMTEGLFEGPCADPAVRAELEARARAEGPAALHAELAGVDPLAGSRIHPNDAKRIIRALEVYRLTGRPISQMQRQWEGTGVEGTGLEGTDSRCGESQSPSFADDEAGTGTISHTTRNGASPLCASLSASPCLIGLRRPKEDLNRRINLRVKKMVEAGLRDEVAALLAEPAGLAPQAAQAVGYAEVIAHLAGRCSFEQAVEQIKINTRKLAKKQRTWQRRFANVTWFDVEGDDFLDDLVERILKNVPLGG